MYRRFFLILIIFSSPNVFGHQDTIIKMLSDGSFEGLPDQYLPAKIELSTWELYISENYFKFPTCISEQLTGIDIDEFTLKASWYNPIIFISDTDYIQAPSYILITITSYDFSILINLETAKPFYMTSPEYAELTNEDICDLL